MSEKYTPQEGDRVRVVLDGEVARAYSDSDSFLVGEEGKRNYIRPNAEHVISIEKIGPPVEVFGPRDTVRHKGNGCVYTIGKGGWLSHQTGLWYPNDDRFTSEDYERVEVKWS